MISPLVADTGQAAGGTVPLIMATEPTSRFPAPLPSFRRQRDDARPPADDPSDAVLMQRASAGDAVAFALIYDRHVSAALRVARRVIRQQGAAEDVVQEAFLALWRSGSYHPAKGSVRRFLLRIVHNGAVDLLRSERSRGSGRHVDEALAHLVAADDEIHVQVERTETARCVRDALATLPEAQQRSLELAYFAGLTHVEIALAIGVPIGTVKSRLRLGLEKLRGQIDTVHWD